MFEIVTFVENDEVESWLKKILGSISKWKVSPVKVVINNGMETYSEEYNQVTKDHSLDTEPSIFFNQLLTSSFSTNVTISNIIPFLSLII